MAHFGSTFAVASASSELASAASARVVAASAAVAVAFVKRKRRECRQSKRDLWKEDFAHWKGRGFEKPVAARKRDEYFAEYVAE